MSSLEGGALDPKRPLSERELEQLHRLLSDPFNYPPELWNWIKAKIEDDPPGITWDSIIGFNQAVVRATEEASLTLIDDYIVAGATLAGYDTNTRLGGDIPQTYKHLRLVFSGNTNGGGSALEVTINALGGTGYYSQRQWGAGVGAAADESIGTSRWRLGDTGASTGYGSYASLEFPDYASSTWAPRCMSTWGVSFNNAAGQFRTGTAVGFHGSPQAITRINLAPSAGQFVIGSRFSLYGIS